MLVFPLLCKRLPEGRRMSSHFQLSRLVWWRDDGKNQSSCSKQRCSGDGVTGFSNKIKLLWMEEILHQLKTMVYPIMYRVSTIRLVVHDFATIHSSTKNGRCLQRLQMWSLVQCWFVSNCWLCWFLSDSEKSLRWVAHPPSRWCCRFLIDQKKRSFSSGNCWVIYLPERWMWAHFNHF